MSKLVVHGFDGSTVVIDPTVTPTVPATLGDRAQTLGQSIIANISTWYKDGVFFLNTNTWFLSTLAPAALLATLARYTASPTLAAEYVEMCIEIVERAIVQNTTSAGLFTTGPGGSVIEGPSQTSQGLNADGGTQSIEATASLGWILLQLPDHAIRPATRARWVSICQKNCDRMDAVGDTTFWINGNFNIHLVSAYWFTAAVSPTGQRARYEDMYERGLAFLQDPVAATGSSFWAGYGVIIDVAGSQFDWSDYQVHVPEVKSGPPMPNGGAGTSWNDTPPYSTFDPEYSTLQLDLLARLYTINRDYRIGRILNGLSTKWESLLNSVAWTYNGAGGSRHNSPNFAYQFGWYAVQALIGAKATNTAMLDQTHLLSMWDASVSPQMLLKSTTGQYDGGQLRRLAITIAVVREASNQAEPKVTAT